MIISFLYVPLLLNSINSTQYGIWLTLTSLLSWISIFDIGLGNGLRNKLSIALANEDISLGRIYVSTAYISIFILVLLFFVIFYITQIFISWDTVLNARNVHINNLDALVVFVFTAFGIQFALGLLNSIMFALQVPAFSSFISMLGQLVSYIVVLILVKFYNLNSLFVLGSLISFIPPFILLISSIVLFNTKYKDLSPSFRYFDKRKVRDIMSLGIKFFIIQIITIILYQTNNLIITHTIGNNAVVEYNIAYKYMHILVMIFSIIATPLWSATSEAFTKRDFTWILAANKRVRTIVLLFTLVGLVMFLISNFSYNLWLGETDFKVSISTTFLLFLYTVAMILYGSYGYFINGIGKLKIQIIFTTLIAIIYVPLAVIAGNIFGLRGILTVFVLSSFCNYVWAKIQFKKIMTGTASGIWDK